MQMCVYPCMCVCVLKYKIPLFIYLHTCNLFFPVVADVYVHMYILARATRPRGIVRASCTIDFVAREI